MALVCVNKNFQKETIALQTDLTTPQLVRLERIEEAMPGNHCHMPPVYLPELGSCEVVTGIPPMGRSAFLSSSHSLHSIPSRPDPPSKRDNDR